MGCFVVSHHDCVAGGMVLGSANTCQIGNLLKQNVTMTTPSTYLPVDLGVFTKSNMAQGESHFVFEEMAQTCVTVWKDRARVIYASNHQRPCGGTVNRLQLDMSRAESDVTCPESGSKYNKARPHVDITDAKALGIGSVEQKMYSHKWWHVVNFGLFDVATVRLEVLATRFKMCTDRRDLLTKLSEELLEKQFDSPVGHCTRSNAQHIDGAITLESRS